ncbi:MAG: hypothetical protein LBD58_07855 [Treponema sp.]|nr:hypothetical protein [Treponema sp.]
MANKDYIPGNDKRFLDRVKKPFTPTRYAGWSVPSALKASLKPCSTLTKPRFIPLKTRTVARLTSYAEMRPGMR